MSKIRFTMMVENEDVTRRLFFLRVLPSSQGLLVDKGGQTEEAEQGVKKVRIVQERKATRIGERSNSSDGYDSKEVIF